MGLLEKGTEWIWTQTLSSLSDDDLRDQIAQLNSRWEREPHNRAKCDRMLDAAMSEVARRTGVGVGTAAGARDIEFLVQLADALRIPAEVFSSVPISEVMSGWSDIDLVVLAHRLRDSARDLPEGREHEALRFALERISPLLKKHDVPPSEAEFVAAIRRVYGDGA